MYSNMPLIQIIPVANGWMVKFPINNADFGFDGVVPAALVDNDENFRKQASIMAKEFKRELLDKSEIEHIVEKSEDEQRKEERINKLLDGMISKTQNPENQNIGNPAQINADLFRNRGIYVFKTYNEALDFLRTSVVE